MYSRVVRRALGLGLLVTLVVLALSACGGGGSGGVQGSEDAGDGEQGMAGNKHIAGVKDIDVGPTGIHILGDVDYDQTPPAGGQHHDVWQNCGFYDEPVRDENAVHSLEHGAVWITYQPDLPQEQIEKLSDLAQSNRFVLVSPYPDLPNKKFENA